MTTTLRLGDRQIPIGGVTYVMGVVNMSPESRTRHTVAPTPQAALAMARRYREAGATLIDLGSQSSHYESPTLDAVTEIDRLLPALELMVADGFWVSVDTWKPQVAKAAISAGAVMVNDTGGLRDPVMRNIVAGSGVAAVVVYIEAEHPHAVDGLVVTADKADITRRWFERRLSGLAADGIDQLVIDPGIAINYPADYAAYTRMQLEVIRRLEVFRDLGHPVLVPIPRKREDHRVAAYITMALEYGADLIRTHDVEWACDLVRLFDRAPV